MGRNPTIIIDATPVAVPEVPQGYVEAVNVMAAADLEVAEQAEAIYGLGSSGGIIQFATFVANISDSAILAAYEDVKKSKGWKYLRSQKAGNAFPNLEAFCEERFGYSERRLRQISGNKELLGGNHFEQAERLGLRQVDYNLIKALPAPKQEIIKEALTEGATKEELQKAIRELAAADQKEIETLTARAEEAEASLEARARTLEDKNSKIDQLSEEVAKVKKRVKALPPADVGEEIRKEVTTLAAQAEVGIRAMRAGLQALADHSEAHGIDHGDFTAGLICQLELTLRQLRGEFDVKTAPDSDDTPEWMREGASEAANALVARQMAAAGWKRDAEGRMVPADTEAEEA